MDQLVNRSSFGALPTDLKLRNGESPLSYDNDLNQACDIIRSNRLLFLMRNKTFFLAGIIFFELLIASLDS